MPSFSKLLAWSALMTVAFAVAGQDPDKLNDLEGRDLHITITSDGDTLSSSSSSSCDPVECFKQCEADGAIGGVCEGSKGCECAYSGSKFQVQKQGARVRLAAQECDLDVCNDVCYQKGGFAGGVCEDDGTCMCVEQTVPQGKEPSFNTRYCRPTPPLGRPLCDNNCNTYSDCAVCTFYERCCWNGKCECGTTGRENTCR